MKKLLFLLGLTVGVVAFTFIIEIIAEMLDRRGVMSMDKTFKPHLVGSSKFRREMDEYGDMSENNCFGLVLQYDPELGDIPIICGCGGSGYLCSDHAQELLIK